MAKKTGFFDGIPLFQLAMLVFLSSFAVMAIAAYYNDYAPAFNNQYAYQSLNRAATVAGSNFLELGFNTPYKKEASGFIFTYLLAIICKIAGTAPMVIIVSVLNAIALFFSAIVFYKIAVDMIGEEYAFLSTAIFTLSAPVITASLSGADVSLNILLLALNIYFCYFDAEKDRYAGGFATAGLMLLSGYFGMVFGAVSIVYLIIKINSKAVRRNYDILIWVAVALGLLSSGLFVYIFTESFNPDTFNVGALFSATTFYVDTFFKDGFLWSKLFPPFFTLFFYFSLFTRLSAEIKEKKTGMTIYFGMLALVSLLAEFFAMFSKETNAVYFLSPFYFVLVLLACRGIIELAGLLGKNNGAVSAKNLAVGALVFIAIYNGILAFNINIDQNRNIRSVLNESYAQKFSGRQ